MSRYHEAVDLAVVEARLKAFFEDDPRGALAVYLYGSVARGQARPGSDIDSGRPCRSSRERGDRVAHERRHESSNVAILLATEDPRMRFASVAEVKNGLSAYLARARRKNEPIVVTHHGKPYALIQPLAEGDLEELEWRQLARKRLARAWEGEEDALYDYL